MQPLLYYHKCDDCLTAFSSTERKIDFCDCMGTVTYMGQVHGDKYQVLENRPACDGRCTHASGPMCDCKCHGANHGTGKLVSTVIHEGKLKCVGLSPEDVERAENFRELRSYAQQFNTTYQSKREFNHAIALRVYDKRTKALIDFITKYKV